MRNKGKGCRICLGGKIYSIPCRAIYFDSIELKETVEFNRFCQIDRGFEGTASQDLTPASDFQSPASVWNLLHNGKHEIPGG